MSVEVVDLGASGLKPTGAVWASCKGASVDDDEAPDFGETPVCFALGFVARPAPADSRGFAQGFVIDAPGYDGVLIGAQDVRCAETYGKLGAGETAVFATGKDYDARALFKDRNISLIVGDNMILQIDGKKKQAILNTPGGTLKISEKDGAVLVDDTGKAMLQLKGGVASLAGKVVLGGRSPLAPVADANKVMAELTKIVAALSAIAGAVPTANPYMAPGQVGAAGVSIGK